MIATQTVGQDQVIKVGEGALVSSKSEPGSWHKTTATTCDCLGFSYRGRCRHIAAVRELERAEIQASVAASPVLESANARRLRPMAYGEMELRQERQEIEARRLRVEAANERARAIVADLF